MTSPTPIVVPGAVAKVAMLPEMERELAGLVPEARAEVAPGAILLYIAVVDSSAPMSVPIV
jgi:hypothetical protein